jgi:ribosomal protein S18 acetylase RimI-like enzyme
MSRRVNPESVEVRRARSGDAPGIARLLLLSAEQLLPALFGPGISTALEDMAAGGGTLFSHRHAWIAEEEGSTRGMLLGYTGAAKRAQDPLTGLVLVRHLKIDMVRRLGPLLRMQSTIGRIGADEYYISNVAVFPDHRGRGIGAMLIARAGAEARSAGSRAVVLDVEIDNPDAQRLYERLGFRVVSETPAVVLNGHEFALRRMAMALRDSYSLLDNW